MKDPRAETRGDDVPEVVAPPPLHPRFPLTVGIRGLAALAIVVGHAWFFSGGFGGLGDNFGNRVVVRWDGFLALFFLLSSFLLYRPMIAHRTGGPGAPKVGDYAKRRFLRLYPAYWVVLTVLAIYPGLYGVFTHNWWAFYTLTDFFDLQHLHSTCPPGGEFRCGLPQSWTLGIDMTFYVALPFYAALAALLARSRPTRSWLKLELVLIALLAGASLILGGPPFDLREHTWFRYTVLGYFYWFGLGLALALVSVAFPRDALPSPFRWLAARPAVCWAGAFAIYVFTVFAFYPAPSVFEFKFGTYTALVLIQGIGAVLLFLPSIFGNPNRGAPAKVLGHPGLMWVGLISYGLLLWHNVIAASLGVFSGGEGQGFWTILTAEVMLAVPLAALSYYLVERPLMKFKYRSPREIFRRWRGRQAVAQPGRPG
jgi:peptidoglycan/LPS O-acetylase OafA/YrhL